MQARQDGAATIQARLKAYLCWIFLQPTLPLLVGFLQNLLDKLGIPLKLRIANTVRRLERAVLVTEGGNKGTVMRR